MSTRETILARLRAARRGSGDDSMVEKYLQARERGPAPVLEADLLKRFLERAPRLSIDVVRVATVSEAPAAVARYCETHALARRGVCWPELLALPWREAGIELNVEAGARAARGDDAIGVTGAFAVIAETVTLMLVSGGDTPASVSLVPETHVAIVTPGQFVATMEDAWALLRARTDAVPRAVNFISGPSRTADVEQTLTLGAHGPRRLLVIVVGE